MLLDVKEVRRDMSESEGEGGGGGEREVGEKSMVGRMEVMGERGRRVGEGEER